MAFAFYFFKDKASIVAGTFGIVHCHKLMHLEVPSVAFFHITSRFETFKK